MPYTIIIVGAGQAGIQVAETLRHERFDGPILLIGDEPHAPYNRPPLSKKWLLDRPAISSLAIRGGDWLTRHNIQLMTSTRVKSIDREQRRVRLADGRELDYRGLAICTGARLRTLPLPGAGLGGVYGLKTVDDALALAAVFDDCLAGNQPVVVIGGGFIGLEVAASVRKRGLAVTVLEGLSRLMSRVVAPIVSEATARVHAAHGVALHFDVNIVALTSANGRVAGVQLADGTVLPAGCVVMGVGVAADEELALAAGLPCNRGIIVDECSRTADPAIVAAGDCTARAMADGSFRRLESVQNAVEQGRAAALALLDRPKPFTAAPWFWSDQYDLKLQMVGLSHGYDRVVTRGDLEKPAFSAYYFRGEQLLAVDSLSRPSDHLQGRRLLDHHVSPTPAQVADAAFPLLSLLPPAAPRPTA
jgi:3-phenylpropionate/trans-cinnamate dioxygenase ferredoxin reductase subunit